MKITCACLFLALSLAQASFAAEAVKPPAPPRARLSPHETTSGVIGDRRTGDRVTITYGRPYTKDHKSGEARVIWGGLVPWDKADRLGADEATLLVTEQPLVVGTTTIPAGAYTLYIVPSASGVSKLVFSTRLGKWGIPVDEGHDLGRFDLAKDTLETPVDQLTLWVGSDPAGGGTIKILWEKTQYSLHFAVKQS